MDAFERISRGLPADLLEASLCFALDEYPDLEIPAYLEQVQLMAEGFEIFRAGERSDWAVLELLNHFFFHELDFSGNATDYYDPRNSYLNEVIDRRLGIPISLSVLYQALAKSAGIVLTGVNFPGHFMLSYPGSHAGERLYIDVFHGGQWLDWDDCAERLRLATGGQTDLVERDFPAMADGEVLGRMLRNLKGIYSRNDFGRCMRVQERLVQLFPNDPAEWRDLGFLYYHTNKPMLAMQTLTETLHKFPEFEEREAVRDYLQRATREAVLLN